jgi:hypothetical protein
LAGTCSLPTGNFAAAGTINGVCGTASTTTANEFVNLFQSGSGLSSWLAGYNSNSAVDGQARFNGVLMNISTQANNPGVSFSIPVLNYSKTFTVSTSPETATWPALADDLKKGDILSKIMNYQATSTPNSPITGVSGVLPTAIAADYNTNFVGSATKIASAPPTALQGPVSNLLGMGLTVGSFETTTPEGKSTVKVTSVPLSYTVRNDMDPRAPA